MADTNRVFFTGRVLAQPELMTSNAGKSFTKIQVEILEEIKGQASSHVIPLTGFGYMSEIFAKLQAGYDVMIEAKLQSREYQGKYYLEVYCLNCKVLATLEAGNEQDIPF
jgi:single-stranded DNA-binding protein